MVLPENGSIPAIPTDRLAIGRGLELISHISHSFRLLAIAANNRGVF
jgi:hypothetical protein